jgi:hypothetical protein
VGRPFGEAAKTEGGCGLCRLRVIPWHSPYKFSVGKVDNHRFLSHFLKSLLIIIPKILNLIFSADCGMETNEPVKNSRRTAVRLNMMYIQVEQMYICA